MKNKPKSLEHRITKLEKRQLRMREVAIASILALSFILALAYSDMQLTTSAVLESATLFAGRENYTMGDMAHLFIAPAGIDYEIEVYDPENKLYAVSLDFPVEKPGKYSAKAKIKEGGQTKEISAEFNVNEPVQVEEDIEELAGLPADESSENITAEGITGSMIENETELPESINLTITKIEETQTPAEQQQQTQQPQNIPQKKEDIEFTESDMEESYELDENNKKIKVLNIKKEGVEIKVRGADKGKIKNAWFKDDVLHIDSAKIKDAEIKIPHEPVSGIFSSPKLYIKEDNENDFKEAVPYCNTSINTAIINNRTINMTTRKCYNSVSIEDDYYVFNVEHFTAYTIGTPVVWVGGQVANALSFDGSDDLVAGGYNALNLNEKNYTISVWFKTNEIDTTTAYNYIIGKYSIGGGCNTRGYILRIVPSTSKILYSSSNSSSCQYPTYSTTSVQVGIWYHIVGVHNLSANRTLLYINGVLESTNNSVIGHYEHPTASPTLVIGHVSDTTSYPHFNGTIDEIKIFNRSLDATEIAAIYANESNGQHWADLDRTGLMLELTLNETNGYKAWDSSGNDRNGTLKNFGNVYNTLQECLDGVNNTANGCSINRGNYSETLAGNSYSIGDAAAGAVKYNTENITIDFNGTTLNSFDEISPGIYITSANATAKNIILWGFTSSFYIAGSDVTILNVSGHSGMMGGSSEFYVESGTNTTIKNYTCTDCSGFGINSNNNTYEDINIINCTTTNSGQGTYCWVDAGQNSIASRMNMTANPEFGAGATGYGFYVSQPIGYTTLNDVSVSGFDNNFAFDQYKNFTLSNCTSSNGYSYDSFTKGNFTVRNFTQINNLVGLNVSTITPSTFEDMRLVNCTANIGLERGCLYIEAVNSSVFRRINVTTEPSDTTGVAVIFTSGSANNVLEDSYIKGNSITALASASASTKEYYNTIRNTTIEDSLIGINVSKPTWTIINNTIRNMTIEAIRYDVTTGLSATATTNITNNTILNAGNTTASNQEHYPMSIITRSNSFNISGNTFEITGGRQNYGSINLTADTTFNTMLWLNNFYSSTVNYTGNTYFCNNGEGNFYKEGLTVPDGDCGPGNFTIPLNGSHVSNATSNTLTITWTAQDSIRTVNYSISYSNNSGANWYPINSTTSLTLVWSILSMYDNNTYMLRAIPFDRNYNGTHVNISFTLDRTKPSTFLMTPADDHNQSSRSISLYFNATDIFSSTLNCSIFMKSVYNSTNSTIINFTASTFNFSELPDNDYWYNITCWDKAGNINSSANRTFRIDATPPTISALNSTPHLNDSVDPNTPINVTANITDPHLIDHATLQYKKGTGGQWNNINMDYNYANKVANASFTTISEDVTYSMRIIANDSLGNNITSDTFNISSYNEHTWNVSPTDFFSTSALLLSNTVIGNLTINNTGDGEEEIMFGFTQNSPYGVAYNDSEPFYLAAKGVKYIAVNATFAPSIREDSFNITLTATHSHTASPPSAIISASIISYAGGPYLSVSIKSYKAAVVHSERDIVLSASVKNLGNETATSTRLNWTLPSEWLILTGNLSQDISSLTAGSTAYNNITIKVNATAEATTVTLAANASCSACTSNYATASVIVSCNSTDSFCGKNCTTSTDLDCTLPAAPVAGPRGGGGSGGGGGGGVSNPMRSGRLVEAPSQKIDLVRGTEKEFPIEITNAFKDATLQDVKIDVAGYLVQYIDIEPKEFDMIEYNETKTFIVKLKAPAYMKYGNHTLDFTITADIIKRTKDNDMITERLTEKRRIILAIQEASSQETNESLEKAEQAVKEMESRGFNTKKASKLLEKAKSIFVAGNYKYAKDITEEILELRDLSIETSGLIEELKSSIEDAESRGIKVIETQKLLSLALVAFDREDYKIAQQRVKDAQLTFALETKGKFNVVNFIFKYYKEIMAAIIAFSFITLIIYGRIRAFLIFNKLKYLDKEELAIKDLIKNVQIECFEKKKLTVLEFHKMMYEYNKRLEKIRHKRIELRSKRVGLLRVSNELKNLQRENDHLLKLMRDVQKEYFETKTADWESYTSKMEALSERRAEVEKSLAMLEAKELLEKRKKQKRGKTAPEKIGEEGYAVEAEISNAQKRFREITRKEAELRESTKEKNFFKRTIKYFAEKTKRKEHHKITFKKPPLKESSLKKRGLSERLHDYLKRRAEQKRLKDIKKHKKIAENLHKAKHILKNNVEEDYIHHTLRNLKKSMKKLGK